MYWWTERITFFKAGLLYIERRCGEGGQIAGHTPAGATKRGRPKPWPLFGILYTTAPFYSRRNCGILYEDLPPCRWEPGG
ncbi:hypothetical protein HMPREF0262_02610 [Clostridium sp. ATCC 29733]|nr:hypothetical protein HMPREF0262_02610 [Clostridium sp. ATCC 29733]